MPMIEMINRQESKPIGHSMEPFAQALRKEKTLLEAWLWDRMQSLQGGRVPLDDDGPVMHEQFVSILQSDLARDKLKAIGNALRRLEAGEYAVCEDCGDAIPERRLRAVPWAAYCVDCQDKLPVYGAPPPGRPLAA